MSKFTKGKWHTDNSYDYILNNDESIVVARVQGGNIFFDTGIGWFKLSAKKAYEMHKANAQLIAEAPEMYRLLQKAVASERMSNITKRKITELLARIDGEEGQA